MDGPKQRDSELWGRCIGKLERTNEGTWQLLGGATPDADR